MSKVAVRLCLAVVALLAPSACSGARSAPPESVSVSGVATEVGPPPTEDTAASEQPLPPREGNPGIPVASLPVGGSSGGLQGSDGAQCLSVNWVLSQDDIPEGLAVEVTAVGFEPDVYRLADTGCSKPSCVGYIFRGSERACDLPVRPAEAGETALSENESVQVSLKGRVLCPDETSALCRNFVEAVESVSATLSLALPTAPEGNPDTGSGATTSEDTTSTADTSTSSDTTTTDPGG